MNGRELNRSAAFTLVELAAILAILMMAGLVAIPALSRSQPVNRTLECLNNNRQLCNAWRMYADDSRDRVVYASDDGTGVNNPQNQYAWVTNHMDFSPFNRGNWDLRYLTNSPLWQYSGNNPLIWKCPSDRSYVTPLGVRRPRNRSMSMNLYVGGFASVPDVEGWPSPYRVFLKTTELTAPGPARTFVLLDMRPDGINWGDFLTDMTGFDPKNPALYQLVEFPGYFHEGGSSISFADGHVELRRWVDPRTTPPPAASLPAAPSPANPDVEWLQDRTTVRK